MENGWLVSLAESLTLCNEPNKGVVSSKAVIRGLSAAEVILNSFMTDAAHFPAKTIGSEEIEPTGVWLNSSALSASTSAR